MMPRSVRGARAARLLSLTLALPLLAACGQPAGQQAAQADPGARVYLVHCAGCHQRDGQGLSGGQVALPGSATVQGDAEALTAWIMFGTPPPTLAPTTSRVVMPQFSWLSDEQLAAVITYVRREFGNGAAAVTTEQVAALRAAHAAR